MFDLPTCHSVNTRKKSSFLKLDFLRVFIFQPLTKRTQEVD